MKRLARPFLGALCGAALATGCSDPDIKGNGSDSPGSGASSGSGSTNGSGPGGTSGSVPGSGKGGSGGGFVFSVPDGGASSGPGGAGSGGPEKTCGFEKFDLERLPPELLLVLDRSGSMKTKDVPMSTNTRWEELIPAVTETIMKTDTLVNWGMKTFPTMSACSVSDGVEVPLAATNSGAVNTFMGGLRPNDDTGGTPTATAVNKATAYLKTLTTKNPKYIVLATDGQPTCTLNAKNGGDSNRSHQDTLAQIRAAATAGFRTFVIGMSSKDPALARQLDEMADAGGEPRMGTPKHYPVLNREEFVKVLNQITVRVSNCLFVLSKQPPSPEDVAVDVSAMRVPQDPANGWSYGAGMKSIQLNGRACEGVKNGKVENVRITFGCPDVVIP